VLDELWCNITRKIKTIFRAVSLLLRLTATGGSPGMFQA